MKQNTITALISLLLIAFAVACRSQQASEPAIQRYELKGRVESLDLKRKRVTVAHQDIKGYMQAMTMDFAVKDENKLQELKSGDQMKATLVKDSSTNLSWLEDIKIIKSQESGVRSQESGVRSSESGVRSSESGAKNPH